MMLLALGFQEAGDRGVLFFFSHPKEKVFKESSKFRPQVSFFYFLFYSVGALYIPLLFWEL